MGAAGAGGGTTAGGGGGAGIRLVSETATETVDTSSVRRVTGRDGIT